MIMQKFITLFLMILSFSTHAQIKGKVYDAANNAPIENVHILSDGKLITTTNQQGKFIIENIPATDSLQFEHLGYKTTWVALKDKTLLSVALKSSSVEISDVTVTAYNRPQKAFGVAGGLEIINTQQIQEISISSPEPVFNSMPGLFMHNGAKNTNRITIRGIGSRSQYTTTKIKAYLNEIPLTSGIGETTLEDLDMDLVNRVTVLKGPASSVYGAALGGTILYNMGTPEEDGLSLKQQTTAGSFGMVKNSSQIKWKNNKTGLQLAYNKLNDRGFRENDNYNRDGLTALFKHQITKDIGVTYLGRFHSLKAYIPSSLDEQTYNANPEKAANNWLAVSGHEAYNRFLNGLSFNIDLAQNLTVNSSMFLKYYNGNEVRPFNILDDNSKTAGSRNLLQWNTQVGKINLTSRAGFEYLFEEYDWNIFETLENGEKGDRLGKNKQKRMNQNYFGSVEARFNKLTVSAGFNLNNTFYDYFDLLTDEKDLSDKKNFDWILSPRISATYNFSGHLMLYSTVSHGFSTPTYEETLNADGYVTGSVKPEKGWNRELGFRYNDRERKIFITLSGYSVSVKDLLVTKRIAEDEFYKINAGQTLHNGMEISGRFHWLNNAFMNSSLHLSYAYSDHQFKDFTDEGTDYSGNHLPGIPRQKTFIQLDARLKKGFYVNTHLLWVDKMPMNDANSLYSDAYSRLNLKAGYQKTLSAKWHLNIYVGIQNLTDNHYAAMILINAPSFGGSPPRYYYPGESRNFLGGISFTYQF